MLVKFCNNLMSIKALFLAHNQLQIIVERQVVHRVLMGVFQEAYHHLSLLLVS